MQEAKFIYQESELDELFHLEGEKIGKIEDYCETTGKELDSQIYISSTLPLLFRLEITIRQQ